VAEAEHSTARENLELAREQSDVNIRVVAASGAGLLVVALVVHLGLYWLLDYYQSNALSRAPAPAVTQAKEPIPPPRLQVSPQTDLAEMRAAEEQMLHTYGWANKERQIVRIPIERAMELLVQRGLPAREPAEDNGVKSRGGEERETQAR
jgi:hypothetical protein